MEYGAKVLQKGKGEHVAIEWQCLACAIQFVYYAEDFEPHYCPACGVDFKELEVGATGDVRKIYRA